MADKLLIGAHVSLKAPDYFLGSVKEALSYNANTLMVYTGAPQSTVRVPIEELKIEEAHKLIKESGLDINKFVCHAPYLINLANPQDEEIQARSRELLKSEMQRTKALGIKILVLHPGSHLGFGQFIGWATLFKNLKMVLDEDDTGVKIALETMAGKGNELSFEYLFRSIHLTDNLVFNHPQLGLCLDTCHIHDYYDYQISYNEFLEYFSFLDNDKILCFHVNDSRLHVDTEIKDRHANIGCGCIGFDFLNQLVHEPRYEGIPMILETPYINGQPPYKKEIEMFKKSEFEENWKDNF